MKIRPVGAELFHVDGQTDRYDEGNSRFPRIIRISSTFTVCHFGGVYLKIA